MSQQPSFIEVVTHLDFRATPTAIRWYANGSDEQYYQLVFAITDFISRRLDGFGDDRNTASSFAVYENGNLCNLSLTTLQVVDIAKFNSEQVKIAGIQGVPFVQDQNIGDEIGRARIGYYEGQEVCCDLGLDQILFQKLMSECKGNQSTVIKISGLLKAKIVNSSQTGSSRIFLIESDSSISIRLYSLTMEQKIGS
ncbi:MAG TPA: hypothetical protein VFQ98_06225 [Gallionella sp.]|nr:hypothetical protein [Gallionella sp.]